MGKRIVLSLDDAIVTEVEFTKHGCRAPYSFTSQGRLVIVHGGSQPTVRP